MNMNGPYIRPYTTHGWAPHAPLGLGVQIALVAIIDSLPVRAERPCPCCGDPTQCTEGPCDFCRGDIRPACRICSVERPNADWSAGDDAGQHRIPAGGFAGQWCPGAVLPVTVLS
jgi:hypothetical protein